MMLSGEGGRPRPRAFWMKALMDFLETVEKQLATRVCWDFRGRAGLSEFWLFVLFATASDMAAGIVAWIAGSAPSPISGRFI